MAQLFGQPDDAALMKEAMNVILDPAVDIETKETAFDNLEMVRLLYVIIRDLSVCSRLIILWF